MILKLDMQHRVPKLYKVFINDDLWLTMTYLTARSIWVALTFELGKTVTKSLNGGNLQQRTILTE